MRRRKIRDELGFTNQNWKRVLKEIVDFAPNRFGRGKNNYGEDHELVELLKINPQELMLIMSFLEEQGLIEYDRSEYNWINLTSKGFDVALQNQNQETTSYLNSAMLLFTAIIALSAVVSIAYPYLTSWIYRVVTLVIYGVGIFLLYKNIYKKRKA